MSAIHTFRYHLMKEAGVPLLMGVNDLQGKLKKPRTPPDWLGPALECNDRLKSIMGKHYLLAKYAKGAMPVAWVTSGTPVEILRVLGFYTVYPENHGAICGARKVGVSMSEPAERAGYSQDICSYARIDLGVALGARGPLGRLPKPDVLVCCTNICQTVMYWYKQLAHHYGVPLLLFDTPYLTGELDEPTLHYMTQQLRDLIPPVERISATDFDEGRFLDVLQIAKATSLLWGDVLGQMKSKPAPMTIFDAFAHMAPVVSLRGLHVAYGYYQALHQELKNRSAAGTGGIKGERTRLLWDNIAVWFKVGEFAKLFGSAGAAFVAATYTNAWAETSRHLNRAKPFESLAKTYSTVILNTDLNYRVQLMSRMIREYDIQGVVFHSTRSCKPYSVGQYDIARRLAKECNVKTVVIEADTTDPRNYAEGPTRTRLEAFLEGFE